MKITGVTAMIAKVMTAGILAGAVLMAAPNKAEAQQFAVGVQVGWPHAYYYHRDRYERVRHDEWVRAHQYHGYRHGSPYSYR